MVYGAGAVGGVVGGRLHQAGCDVVLIARGAHGEAIRKDGLLLRSPGEDARLDVPCVSRPDEVDWRDDDVVLLGVKSQDTPAALDDLVAAAGEVPLVCLQNGVANERAALRLLPDVHGICVMLPSTHLRPGEVQADCAPVTGILDIGRAEGGTDDLDQAVADALSQARFVSQPRPDIMAWKHRKLLSNLGNAVDALCGRGGPAASRLVALARVEAEAALTAAGIAFVTEEQDRDRRGELLQVGNVEGSPRVGSSSAQSLARGTGTVEADYLNGEIALLARLHGTPAPVNALLQRRTREAARDCVAPGATDAEALLAEAETLPQR